jgi:hydrogenase-4 component F
MPVTGSVLLMATLAVTGTPPFSMFQSEFTVLRAGFTSGHVGAAAICVGFLAAIFAGFLVHFSRLVLGAGPAAHRSASATEKEPSQWKMYSLIGLGAVVVTLAFWLPGPLFQLIRNAARIASGER